MLIVMISSISIFQEQEDLYADDDDRSDVHEEGEMSAEMEADEAVENSRPAALTRLAKNVMYRVLHLV